MARHIAARPAAEPLPAAGNRSIYGRSRRIENAADRQMAHVRSFQSGKNSDLSQRLLNEIADAKVCLLDHEKKLAYE
jgi:hypothetical protein